HHGEIKDSHTLAQKQSNKGLYAHVQYSREEESLDPVTPKASSKKNNLDHSELNLQHYMPRTDV
ncbi:hypothetical protein NDU88_002597, partial [Pleurodeles waltl]